MNRTALKFSICCIGILSIVLISGCNKNTEEQPTSTIAAPAAQTPALEVPSAGLGTGAQSTSPENQEKLGLFSGKFDPTREYLEAKTAYEKWTYEVTNNGDTDYQASRDLNDTPEEFRSYMYKNPLYGYYTFISPNRLSIVMDAIFDDGTFKARSVAAGNERLITGTWKKLDYGWHLSGTEPGDDENDGKFEMILTRTKLIGTWTPNKNPEGAKEFTLAKTYYDYDPVIGQGDGRFYVDLGRSGFEKNPSVDKLSTTDVENLKQPTIRMIRNLIFARHGYSFNNKDLRLVFEGYEWYTPVTNDVKETLTETEKANLALLVRYEKYADANYDEYGR
jgi:YARHG domain